MSGRIIGVGVGPGDPELLTVRAVRLIGEADVVVYHSAKHGKSIARRAIEPYLREGQREVALLYPLTTEGTTHPGGYRGAMEDFYVEAAATLAGLLDEGLFVVVACEGDPGFYGSYQHLHDRLKDRYDATIVPGIPSISAAAAAAGVPIVMNEQTLVVVPGTLPEDEIIGRIAGADTVAILKLGRPFAKVRAALQRLGVSDRTLYVERAGTTGQRVEAIDDVDPETVPYMSLALLPGVVDPQPTPRAQGRVTVVGLGPGSHSRLTAEVARALADATDIVGYETYVNRVPTRRGQRRHATDNRVEAERAAHAIELASTGADVVVVSSGDAGIFAMAAAVVEAAEGSDVSLRVLPGVSAVQAVAAKVGAAIGHDFCVISLSTILKPWEIVESRLRAAAESDLVIALYNPASSKRRDEIIAARQLLLEVRKPSTVVVLARDVDGPDESITVTTLDELDPETVDMRTMVLVGSSQTRTWTDRSGAPVVLTPRRYPS